MTHYWVSRRDFSVIRLSGLSWLGLRVMIMIMIMAWGYGLVSGVWIGKVLGLAVVVMLGVTFRVNITNNRNPIVLIYHGTMSWVRRDLIAVKDPPFFVDLFDKRRKETANRVAYPLFTIMHIIRCT